MKRTTDQYLKSPTNVGKEGKRASDQCLKSLTNVDKVDEKQERAVLKILRSAQNDEKSEVTDQSLKSPTNIGKEDKKFKFLIPIFFTIAVILLFHYTQIFAVKFYPVCANLTVFLIFFTSLFAKETVIQKIAKQIEGELDEFTKNYTRKLTYVWCVFCFCNLIISIITVFLPEKIWALYNGCISYIAIGLMFAVEYMVRMVIRR